MFTLFYGLWKSWFKKDEFFALIIGLDNAGKSTLLEQAKIQFDPNSNRSNSLRHITTTVGLNIGKLITDGVVINFWDLGGQRELQALWNKVCSQHSDRIPYF
jgi:ADP-ribosylation factor related protein 1